MKKLVLLSLLVAGLTSVNAQEKSGQTAQGNIFLNGGVSLSTQSFKVKSDVQDADNGSDFNVTFAPKAGYFVIDNLVAGLQFNANFRNEKDDTGFEDATFKTTTLNVGPFVRYYIVEGFFAETNVGFGSSDFKYNDQDSSKVSLFQFGGGLGYAIFVGEKVSIEPFLQYQNSSSKQKDDNPQNFKFVNSGVQFGVSLSAYL